MRLLLATGSEKIDRELIKMFREENFVWDCYHRSAIVPVAQDHKADVVVVGQAMDENQEELIPMQLIIEGLRDIPARVIYLPGSYTDYKTRQLMKQVLPLGVLDFVCDPVTAEKVAYRINHPAGLRDIDADLRKEALAEETVSGLVPDITELTKNAWGNLKGKMPLGSSSGAPAEAVEKLQVSEQSWDLAEHDGNSSEDALSVDFNNAEEVTAPAPVMPADFLLFDSVATIEEIAERKPLAVLIPESENVLEKIKNLRREYTLTGVLIVVVGQSRGEYYAAGADECIGALTPENEALLRAKSLRMQEMWQKSSKDDLTGLLRRDFMDVYLSEQVKIFNEVNTPFSVVMSDLDHFKDVNDTYGHLAGDEVLRAFGAFLSKSVRKSDVNVRFGGEEFLVVFPRTRLNEAYMIAEKIRSSWQEQEIQTEAGVLKCTVSMGVAECIAGCTPEKLISDADSALYRAKQRGRNQVVRSDDHREEAVEPQEVVASDVAIVFDRDKSENKQAVQPRIRSSTIFRKKTNVLDISSITKDLTGRIVAVWNVNNFKKSETCINVALAMRAFPHKVVLVEFDLTNPALDGAFNIPKPDLDEVRGKNMAAIGTGLLTLGNRAKALHLAKLVQPVKKIKNAFYLPAGNDLGVLTSSQRYASVDTYKELLDVLKANYETVLIDVEVNQEVPTTLAALAKAQVVLIPLENEDDIKRYQVYKQILAGEIIFCRPE